MRDPITVDHGFVHMDAQAWVDQRVGAELPDLTGALVDFGHHERFGEYPLDRLDAMPRAELWCAARGYPVDEGQPIEHDDQILSRPVSILCATTDTGEAIAIVTVDDNEPTVSVDRTTDPGYWHQADQVDIACTGCDQRWTWSLTSAQVLAHQGGACHESPIAAVFGTDEGAPFTPCEACAAFDAGTTDASCPGDHDPRITCPTCGADCHLCLTDVPAYDLAPPAL